MCLHCYTGSVDKKRLTGRGRGYGGCGWGWRPKIRGMRWGEWVFRGIHFIFPLYPPPNKKNDFYNAKKNIELRIKLKNGLRISFGCYFKTNFFVVVFCFYYKGYFSFENIFAKIQYFNCNFVKCSKNHLQRYPLNFNLRNIVTFFS